MKVKWYEIPIVIFWPLSAPVVFLLYYLNYININEQSQIPGQPH